MRVESAYFPMRGGRSQLENVVHSMELSIAKWNQRLNAHEILERAHAMCRESGVRISERDAVAFKAERMQLESSMLDECRALGRWAAKRGYKLRGL